ncbi:glycosyltransferase 61 family protein [Viridibacterium curvum]|uniref:Glycosyltransferase 61 catalytic domain-containing protein n=1 Tax=Viridibacterium curvum TaxID=1101404 RepID=A0ABP9R1D0_9RHOO
MTDQSITNTQQARPAPPELSSALYARAEQLVAAGDLDAACGLLLQLVEADCADWQPYNDLGVIALQRGDVETALYFLQQAVLREAGSHTAASNAAAALQMAGRQADAATLWGETLARHAPDAPPELLDFLAANLREKAVLPAFLAGLKHTWLGNKTASATPPHLLQRPLFLPLQGLGTLPSAGEVFPQETLPPVTAREFFTHSTPAAAPEFAAIHRYEPGNAIVRPFSDVVQTDTAILVPDFFDPEHHMLYDTFTGHVVPLPGQNMGVVRPCSPQQYLPRGVVLNSYAVSNWAHFLTEVLPLVAIVEHCGLPEDIPLVLSEGILPQMLQLLSMIKTARRPIVLIRAPVRIGKATLFTPVSTVVYDYMDALGNRQPRFTAQDTLFSSFALRLTAAALRTGHEHRNGPGTKVFIDRESSIRRIRNKAAVLRLFRERGFRVVVPESLSAAEQLALFSQASIIAGQAGAGMANMMFAPAGCKVITLAPATAFGAYGYFRNMAASLGHELYSFGFAPLPGAYHSPAHPDFDVDIDLLDHELSKLS